MTKEQLNLLERVFAAETEGRLYQSKDKRFKALEADGCVTHVKQTVAKDRFGPIVVSGWSLTHRGRILYCQSCEFIMRTSKPKLFLGIEGNNLHLFVSPCCLIPLSLEPLCRLVCGGCGKTVKQTQAVYSPISSQP